MTGPTLNVEALYTDVDRLRRSRRIHFRDVAAEAGVSASTLTRIGHGRRPDADGLVRLLVWLGTTDLKAYIAANPQTCCGDARACAGEAETLHTGGCPNRCSTPVPIPPGAESAVSHYPCALTRGHDGKCWLHPSYRPAEQDGDGR